MIIADSSDFVYAFNKKERRMSGFLLEQLEKQPNRILINVCHLFYYTFRTKWKRQTAVGLELLAEAGKILMNFLYITLKFRFSCRF